MAFEEEDEVEEAQKHRRRLHFFRHNVPDKIKCSSLQAEVLLLFTCSLESHIKNFAKITLFFKIVERPLHTENGKKGIGIVSPYMLFALTCRQGMFYSLRVCKMFDKL